MIYEFILNLCFVLTWQIYKNCVNLYKIKLKTTENGKSR